MAISKIVYKSSSSATGTVWMDATTATATASDIIAPKTAMLADGVVTTGTGTGGGGTVNDWELIADVTSTEDLTQFDITTDNNGQPFILREMLVRAMLPQSTTGNNDYIAGSTYVTYSDDSKNWASMSTLRYTSGSAAVYFEYKYELICGFYYSIAKQGSAFNNSQNGLVLSYPGFDPTKTVKGLSGLRLKQYSSTTSLIPSGTRIQVYGIRI